MQVLHVVVKYLQENNQSYVKSRERRTITEDAKDKFSASFLGTVVGKHVSQVFAGGCSIIFLAIKCVQLVIFFPYNQSV